MTGFLHEHIWFLSLPFVPSQLSRKGGSPIWEGFVGIQYDWEGVFRSCNFDMIALCDISI